VPRSYHAAQYGRDQDENAGAAGGAVLGQLRGAGDRTCRPGSAQRAGPDPAPSATREQGTDLGYLEGLLGCWADGFDFEAAERELNRFDQYRVVLDGVRIHFVHQRASGGRGIPLILGHGWPSAFTELLALAPLLTSPAGFGIDGPPFDVVVPSVPRYG